MDMNRKVMMKLFMICLCVLIIAACEGKMDNNKQLSELDSIENPLSTKFINVEKVNGEENKFVKLDISEEFLKYWEENDSGPISTEERIVLVEISDNLELINLYGENIEIESLKEGDQIYIDYSMSDIIRPNSIEKFIEVQKLIVDKNS